MKKCAVCANENADEMNFCLECGTPLGISAPGVQPTNQSNVDTVAFNRQSVPTIVGGQANFPAVSAAKPRRNKTIFWVVGGVLTAFALLLMAGAGLVYYGLQQKRSVVSNPKPIASPARVAESKTPKPSPSMNASPSPDVSSSPDASSSPDVSSSPGASSSSDDSETPPTSSAAPSKEPTKKGSFTVSANRGWQASDIEVVASEMFQTKASGSIDVAEVKKGVLSKGVSGDKAKSRRIYPDFPLGALLMRTRLPNGKFSEVQPVTAAPSLGVWQNLPDEQGKLEFCVNDNAPENNSGQFTVTITMLLVIPQ